MEEVVKFLGTVGNCAVVKIQERKYPGIVFQGDTVKSYIEQLTAVINSVREGRADVALEECEDIKNTLEGYLLGYEVLCRKNGFE
ncbi:DUF6959 family protein [Acidovorax sp. NCPPB 4044]|uniref:DUF6959 family protein n=1 Tax=Acidovorax sp. NCPPB 4044 TaxID=2940490 RepID=UPI002303CBFA|nr:hypothetical protein [Acidovorax sp. NCPPB 4044]MDA8523444.1 hypothetical protein [Acidovorax sp. NCPPB 4044]